MEKQVARIRNKMIGVISVIALLALWQREFIAEGVMAHVYMNVTILGTFGFGIVMSFIFIAKLKNELIAFNALKEMWDDIRIGRIEGTRDPLWRHYRCAQPGRLFVRPRILGHAYDLVTDELARTKKIRVSVETMNTLVHKIAETISDEKSLLVYMSGLLVFMGLIGTFIGLLHMVGAMGGIIGGLANSAGGAEASGAFQELLGALQEPLKGMASGFASSLFGLFGSLVVGLLGRFAGQAAGVLKHEFEAWLAGVVQIGEDEGERAVAHAPVSVHGSDVEPALVRMVSSILSDYTKVAGSFDLTARLFQDMRNAQVGQSEIVERLVAQQGEMIGHQTAILNEIRALGPIGPALSDLGTSLDALGTTVSRRIEVEVATLRALIHAMDQSHAQTLRTLSSVQLQTTTQMATAVDQLSADIDRRMTTPSPALLEATLEQSVRHGLTEVGRALMTQSERAEARIAQIVTSQAQAVNELARQARTESVDGAHARTSAMLNQSLSNGFAQINQTLENAFSAYSSLLHVAIGSMERAAQLAAERDMPKQTETVERPDNNDQRFTRAITELQDLVETFRHRAGSNG